MTVAELIAELQDMPLDASVHFSYNYGDHWRTMVAPEVGTVEEGHVIHSEYHNMDRMIEEDEKRFDDATPVVIIRT